MSGIPESESSSRWPLWRAIVAVLLVFLTYSFIQAPIPGVNEPHYLAKARHYWLPDWCPGDFFLESSNPHLVFYQTFGLLTRFFELTTAALIGRVVGYGLLATGWTMALVSMGASRRSTVTAACLFILIAVLVTLSGEWLIGGIESKVVSYALVFMAIAAVCRSRNIAAGALLGAAISFHPVVGIWCTGCAVCGILWRDRKSLGQWFSPRSFARTTLPILAAIAVCSLPGLIPAISIIRDSQLTAAERLDADFIQVFHRIAHHLDPMRFSSVRYVSYAGMFVVWLALERKFDATAARRFWRGFVVTAVLVAVVGVLLGVGPRPATEMAGYAWRGMLLKFYPFRVGDVIVPLAFSLSLAQLVWRGLESNSTSPQPARKLTRSRLIWAGTIAVWFAACAYPATSRNPSRLSPESLEDWIQACRWIESETEPHQITHTPRDGWGFKWYANRPEYFSPKDCPQESAGLLEWFERARMARTWEFRARKNGGFDASALATIRDETGADWMITWARFELPDPPVVEHGNFVIIDLQAYDLEQPAN